MAPRARLSFSKLRPGLYRADHEGATYEIERSATGMYRARRVYTVGPIYTARAAIGDFATLQAAQIRCQQLAGAQQDGRR